MIFSFQSLKEEDYITLDVNIFARSFKQRILQCLQRGTQKARNDLLEHSTQPITMPFSKHARNYLFLFRPKGPATPYE